MTDTSHKIKGHKIGSDKDIWGLINLVVNEVFKKDFAKMRGYYIRTLDLEIEDSGFIASVCAIKCVGLAK